MALSTRDIQAIGALFCSDLDSHALASALGIEVGQARTVMQKLTHSGLAEKSKHKVKSVTGISSIAWKLTRKGLAEHKRILSKSTLVEI